MIPVLAPNPPPAVDPAPSDRRRPRRPLVAVLALLAALAGPARRADAAAPEPVAASAASERALESPLDAPLPYREALRIDGGRPEVLAYRLDVRRGEKLTIAVDGPERAAVSLDLLEPTADGHRLVHRAAAGARTLEYEVGREQLLLLRVHASHDVAGDLTLTIRRGASLAFPVAGKPRAIGSMFGAPRAGGKRTHHGVDIFAPRGDGWREGTGGG